MGNTAYKCVGVVSEQLISTAGYSVSTKYNGQIRLSHNLRQALISASNLDILARHAGAHGALTGSPAQVDRGLGELVGYARSRRRAAEIEAAATAAREWARPPTFLSEELRSTHADLLESVAALKVISPEHQQMLAGELAAAAVLAAAARDAPPTPAGFGSPVAYDAVMTYLATANPVCQFGADAKLGCKVVNLLLDLAGHKYDAWSADVTVSDAGAKHIAKSYFELVRSERVHAAKVREWIRLDPAGDQSDALSAEVGWYTEIKNKRINLIRGTTGLWKHLYVDNLRVVISCLDNTEPAGATATATGTGTEPDGAASVRADVVAASKINGDRVLYSTVCSKSAMCIPPGTTLGKLDIHFVD
jgi:hypothetical protein